MNRRAGFVGLLGSALLVGCRSFPSDAHPRVATVKVTPARDTIAFRGSLSLVATPLDGNGNPAIPAGSAVWSSYSPTVLTVDTSGNVHSIWYGHGAIHVEIDGVGADAAIFVTDPLIDTVQITSIPLNDVERGDTIQLHGTAYNSVPVPIQTGLAWTVSDSTVLKVDSTGRVVALNVGTASVSAALGGHSASVTVHVLVPTAAVTSLPDSFTIPYDRLTAIRIVARDSAGNPLTDRPVSLQAVAGGTAVGLPVALMAGDTMADFHGITPGTALVVASAGHRTDTLRVRVAPLSLRSVSAGDTFTCGLSADSTAYCWGDYQSTGTGDTASGPRPRLVAGGLKFVSLSTAQQAACGLTATGAAYCWGVSMNGLVFTSQPYRRLSPVPVVDSLRFSELTVYDQVACGITLSGSAVCWGAGWGFTPTVIPGGLTYSHLYMGGGGKCASLSSTSAIYCWDPFTQPTPAPLDSAVPLSTFASGNVGRSCGLAAGSLYCWGPFQRWYAPGTFSGAAVMYGSVCVLDGAGAASCAAADSAALVSQQNAVPLVSLSAGYDHLCGIGTDGLAYCWGNSGGQLGFVSTPGTVTTPHAVMNQK